MGLDMYMTKETNVKNWDWDKKREKIKVTVTKGKKPHPEIKPSRVEEITEGIITWRKANAIHQWFVENVQGGKDECQKTEIDMDDLKKLLEILREISKDHLKAPNLLPTTTGFFFGGEEYDDYYFEEVEETMKILEEVVKEETGKFYYQSSW